MQNKLFSAFCLFLLLASFGRAEDQYQVYLRVNLDKVNLQAGAWTPQPLQQKTNAGPNQNPNPGPMPTNPGTTGPTAPQAPLPGQPIVPIEVTQQNIDVTLPFIGVFVNVKVDPKNGTGVKTDPFPYVICDHKWGKKAYIPISVGSKISPLAVKLDPFEAIFNRKFKDATKPPAKGKEVDRLAVSVSLLSLADWTLSRGEVAKFEQVMEEYAKYVPENDSRVKNFIRVNKALGKGFGEIDPHCRGLEDEMKLNNYRKVLSSKNHYVIWTNVALGDRSVERRLQLLEDTLATFYYWFALQKDLAQPALPKHMLMAVLVATPNEFRNRYHAAWGSPPLVGDGFTTRRENVIILSQRRLDPMFEDFEKELDRLVSSLAPFPKDELLTGSIWAKLSPDMNKKSAEFTRASTLTLMHKALLDAAERETISHEGTRQLLVASELFPRNVQVPEWVSVGLSSLFETSMTAPYPTIGRPSWSKLIAFKHFRLTPRSPSTKSTEIKSTEVLIKLLGDDYFRDALRSLNEWEDNKGNDLLAKKSQEDMEIARSNAWSFVYYLANNNKLNLLLRYGQELEQLPRDLDLDERAMQGAFARAFEVSNALDLNRIDTGSLGRLSQEWFEDMTRVNLDISEIEQTMMLEREREPLKK